MFKIRLQKVFIANEKKHYVYAQISANGGLYSTFTICREWLSEAIRNLIKDYQYGWGFDKTPAITYAVGSISGIETLEDAWAYACEFSAIEIPEINCYSAAKIF